MSQRIANRSKTAFFLLIAAILSLFALLACFRTTDLGADNHVLESVSLRRDWWVGNLLGLILALAFTFALWQWLNKTHKGFYALVLVVVFTLSVLWIAAVSSIPAADSASVTVLAARAARGQVKTFGTLPYLSTWSYEALFPFQLGYVQILEWLFRLARNYSHGVALAQLVNAAALVAGYLALHKVTACLFSDRRIINLTLIGMLLLPQPMLYTTFVYGNLLSFGFASWAVLLFLRFRQHLRVRALVGTVVCSFFAVTAKQNQLIMVIAFVLILLLDALKLGRLARSKLAARSAMLICLLLVLVFSNRIWITSYEWRSGHKIGSGLPRAAWLYEGLTDSIRAPGWATGYMQELPEKALAAGLTVEQVVSNDLAERLADMSKDLPGSFSFFRQKVESQWNEPTFGSIWVSAVRAHARPIGPLATSVYDGRLGQGIRLFSDRLLFVLYSMSALSLWVLIARKKDTAGRLLLPLILLGVFLYHLLFEAKSQYVFVYIPYLLPYAAHGLVTATTRLKLIKK